MPPPVLTSAGRQQDASRRAIVAFAGEGTLGWDELLGAPVRWPRPSRLDEPLKLTGRVARAMTTLQLETVGDLIEHLPRDHREGRAIAQLKPGDQATVAVTVGSIAGRAVRTPKGTRRGMRGVVEATVADETGSMRATFFNQPWLVRTYSPGTRVVLHGKMDGGGRFRVSHHALGSTVEAGTDKAGSIVTAGTDRVGSMVAGAAEGAAVAHYAAAEGVSSTQIMTLVRGVRERLQDVVEPLDGRARAAQRLPSRSGALAAMHFPRDRDDVREARERLAFDELLLTQLVFLARRELRARCGAALALGEPPSLSARWLERELPFELTGEQRAAMARIERDLARTRPMQRLLMGEVGSGKTVVALYAMLRAVEHGAQAAMMAPTETLAEQHFATVQRLLGAESVRCELLTGSTSARRRREILGRLQSGELSLLVGTHALIEPDVRFRRLAVVVVDEQHRFGVRQRAALQDRDPAHPPHTLHMTATPIPRTLQLTRYGDLERLVLRELPRGRQAIETRIVTGDAMRARAYEHVREQLRAGRQAYVVCPLVEHAREDSEVGDPVAGVAGSGAMSTGVAGDGLDAAGIARESGLSSEEQAQEMRAAKAEFERLREGELQGWGMALLHGQMRAREKQEAMEAFASGRARVLVATTVIEVGVDVPNATVMLVENAERFGISQLHQLRGRVGRGEHRSTCLLVGSERSARLRALVEHSDGFRLAEIDLRMRGEGELIGTRQSGEQFTIASLPGDAQLLERARAMAEQIMEGDPQLCEPQHALLGWALERAFGGDVLRPIAA